MTTATALGWGVVGTGDVSRSIAADLSMINGSARVAVLSRSIERGSRFAQELGFDRSHVGLDEMLADNAVHIVYIGTPHSTHADIAVRCLEAGKHVLVEKPLGVSPADVERVARAARAHRRFAMEAMWMRFHPYYRALLEDLRAGAIGEPTAVRAYFGLPFGERHSPRWSAERSSSTLLDQGIYPVTLAYDVFGEPDSISATAEVRDDGVDLSCRATLEFEGGRFAHVAASMVGFLEPSASISGTAGWLGVPAPFWATNQYSRHTGDLGRALMFPERLEFEREGNGYVPMLRAVSLAIADGLVEHPLHPLSETLAVARILDSISTAAAAALPLEIPS